MWSRLKGLPKCASCRPLSSECQWQTFSRKNEVVRINLPPALHRRGEQDSSTVRQDQWPVLIVGAASTVKDRPPMSQNQPRPHSANGRNEYTCFRCGKPHDFFGSCPARNAECYKCRTQSVISGECALDRDKTNFRLWQCCMSTTWWRWGWYRLRYRWC